MPAFDNSDIFLLDGMELVPCTPETESPSCDYPASSLYKSYSTKIETFQRIAFDPRVSPTGHWYVWTKSGTKLTYWTTYADYLGLNGGFTWHLGVVEDTLGNVVRYGYRSDPSPGVVYLDAIAYNGVLIKFYSEARPDIITSGIGTRILTSTMRLKSIDITVKGKRVRTYTLGYTVLPDTGRSFLTGMQQYGTDAQVSSAGDVTNKASIAALPAMTWTPDQTSNSILWSTRDRSDSGWGLPLDGGRLPPVVNGVSLPIDAPYRRFTPANLGDVDGNGQTDWVQAAPDLVFDPTGRHRKVLVSVALAGKTSPIYVQHTLTWQGSGLIKQSLAADVNGDGRSDIVFVVLGKVIASENIDVGPYYLHFKVALSKGDGTFAWATGSAESTWETRENSSNRVSTCHVGDLSGDGRDDLACSFTRGNGTHFVGSLLSRGDGTFTVVEEPAPFATQGETRMMAVGDANGDGLADAAFLDFPHCPAGSSSCSVTYEIVTAYSRGNGTHQYVRQATGWSRSGGTFFAADINGDRKSDFILFKGLSPNSTDNGAIRTAMSRWENSYIISEQSIPRTLQAVEHSVSVGDADGDGRADLLVLSQQAPGKSGCSSQLKGPHVNLHRVLSRGNGYFDLPVSWESCQGTRELDIAWDDVRFTPVEPQAADLNGDGAADFLIAVAKENQTFTTLYEDLSSHPTGDAFNWRSAEVNGDGRADWVYIRYTPTGPLIYTMLAAGATYSFAGQSPFADTERFSVLRNWNIGDVNADGRDDLIYLQYLSPELGLEISTWFSNGDGTWRNSSDRVMVGLPETSRNTPSWMVGDINGDGKADLIQVTNEKTKPTVRVLEGTGLGTWTAHDYQPPAGWSTGDTINWRLGDVNGDGKSDLIHVSFVAPGIRTHTLLSAGDGTWRPPRFAVRNVWAQGQPGAASYDTLAWRSMDINGDGLSDLVHLATTDPRPGMATKLNIHSLIAHGDGSWTAQYSQPDSTFVGDMVHWNGAYLDADNRTDLVHVRVAPPAVTATVLRYSDSGDWQLSVPNNIVSTVSRTTTGVWWKVADVDGDGYSDLSRFDLLQPGMRLFTLRSSPSSELLVASANGFGGTTEVDYAPSSAYMLNSVPTRCHLPQGLTLDVVAEVRVSDGRSSVESKESYRYSCARWSYQERTLLTWEEQTAFQPGAEHRPSSAEVSRFDASDECLVQPSYWQIQDDVGKPIQKAITSYLPPGSRAPYTCLANYQNQVELNQGSTGLNVYTYYQYDEFGNVTQLIEYGADGTNNADERTTQTLYRPAVGPYIVGLPYQETDSGGAFPPKTIHRITYFCYDGDNGTDQTSCDGRISKGLLTATKVVNPTGWYDTTTFVHDSHGNVSVITDANGNSTTFEYDNVHHLYPNKTCNELQQCETLEWDLSLGQITASVDVDGLRTEYQYDSFGRPKLTKLPSGATQLYRYLDWGNPEAQRVRQQANDGSREGLWTERYFDGLGRTYLTHAKGNTARSVFAQELVYADATMLPYKQSLWYATGSTPTYETLYYDSVGRLERQLHPDGTSVRWSYGNTAINSWVTIQDELGHERTVYYDAYGRTARVREMNANTPADTTYIYNTVDELLSIIDAEGNTTTLTWDARGHNRSVTDPDRGHWSYKFDRVGNVTEQVDGKGARTTFSYDDLGRIKTAKYPSYRTVMWKYDEPNHGASGGRVTSVIDTQEYLCPLRPGEGYVVKEFHYDSMGRLASQKQCIEGKSFKLSFTYDDIGRLKSIAYPDGEVVTYTYDRAGRLRSVSGYVRQFTYDAAGQVTSAHLDNGVRESFTYDSNRTWLNSITVTNGTKTLFDAEYTHFGNGLLKTSSSTTNKMNLAYAYDALDRLTQVTGDFEQSVEYDAIGNITYNSEIGYYSYEYSSGPSQGCGGSASISCPHAVKQAGDSTLRYDGNGNLQSIESEGTGGIQSRTINWNVDNQPYRFQDPSGNVTTVRYDASGHRSYRALADETTLYFDRYLDLSYETGNTSVSATQYYYAGPILLAKKDDTGTYWYHQDHLGSPRLVTDETGAVVARTDYEPFGNTLSNSGTGSGEIQFTGHRFDVENELIYMNARYYDPEVGRFISPDPIIPNISNPQALNRYTYVYNIPVNYIDPTGFQASPAPQSPTTGRPKDLGEFLDLPWDRQLHLIHEVAPNAQRVGRGEGWSPTYNELLELEVENTKAMVWGAFGGLTNNLLAVGRTVPGIPAYLNPAWSTRPGPWLYRGAEKDPFYRSLSTQDKRYYEIGLKSMPDAHFRLWRMKHPNDLVARGKAMCEVGLCYVLRPHPIMEFRLWWTGASPSVRVIAPYVQYPSWALASHGPMSVSLTSLYISIASTQNPLPQSYVRDNDPPFVPVHTPSDATGFIEMMPDQPGP